MSRKSKNKRIDERRVREILKEERPKLVKETVHVLKNEKKVLSSIVTPICTIISCIVALCVFILSEFPSLNIFSTNYLRKAEAGNSYCQVYLAHHYYEIGDLDDSIYWYKLATIRGKYRSLAYNNLAVIYYKYYKDNPENDTYFDKAYMLVKKSAELGNSIGVNNLYTFVWYYDIEKLESDIESRNEVVRILVDNGLIREISDIIDIPTVWEDAGVVVTNDEVLYTYEYIKYTPINVTRFRDSSYNNKYITKRVYKFEESNRNPDRMLLQYDDLMDGFE